MRNILRKEMRLSASVLSYLFILFGLMFFVPGYPVLCGAFFVALGLFQSFQTSCAFLLMALAAVLRMTVFSQSAVYRGNALMNANFFALGMACVIFGLFNWIFVGGFFKTAYKFARPFVTFIIVCFLVIFIAEALHHVPGLDKLNAFGTDDLAMQLILLAAGIFIFLLLTVLSCRRACEQFERIDL